MKKRVISTWVVFFILGSFFWAFEPDARMRAPEHQRPAYVPGELLVQYRPSLSAAATSHYQTHWGISSVRTFKTIGVQHLKLPEDMTVAEALEVFGTDPDVLYAEPNYYVHATATPDDTHFGWLWGLHNTGQSVNGSGGTPDADIDAPGAWDITTGSTDVVIAVIDSGVDYNHPDLAANVWANPGEVPGNGEDDDGNGHVDDVRGWDFVDNDNIPIDPHGHGTHVAGTIAAVGNNSTGITGVCWTARIIPLRFLNAFGIGTTDKAISAIEYANDKGAHIINNSWGGTGPSQFLKDAIDASAAAVVCAAGNDGTNNDSTPFYPASYTSSNIIAVAATDQNDELAWFSNYGVTSVDVAAPGTYTYSCKPARLTVWSDNFDDGDASDWLTGGTNDTWDTTNFLSYSSPYSLADSPGGDYQNDTGSWATTPVLNLLSYTGTKLEFKLRGSSEPGFDFLYVQASTDSLNWTNQGILIGSTVYDAISGTSSGNWLSASADLGAYDGNGTVYVQFHFTSDDSIVDDGWYIDDVTVTAASSTYNGTEYQFLQGTSMAAPHVSGIAGLIKTINPSLTHTEIKLAIESSVDPKDSLSGLVATGGRVNVYNALTPPASPSSLGAAVASAYRINLSWADNAQNEMGFKIERKTGSGGSFSQITAVPPNVTSYSDTGVGPSTTYSYRIRAYNATGNSGYSNEADAATGATPPPSDSGSNICFISAAGHDSFGADHFIPALVILLLGMAGIGVAITVKRRRT